jgi:hypothetical protein
VALRRQRQMCIRDSRQTAALAKKFKPNAGIELPATGQVY